MKKYFINNAPVTKTEFEKQLCRCCTKGTENGVHVAAGAPGGGCDYAHYNDLTDKLLSGWRYTCVYPPREINMTFYIKEAAK